MDSKPKEQPRLIVISAPSGAGKTTLCKRLINHFSNIRLSISTTTRSRRSDEKEGIHYDFLSPEEFKKKQASGEFAEWAEVHGNLYGTPKKNIERALSDGKHLLFDIDVQGAKSLKKLYGNRALLIFIHPPSINELKKRLLKRKGDTTEAIETRLQNAYDELEWSQNFDYHITNDNLDRAFQELREIVTKECQ